MKSIYLAVLAATLSLSATWSLFAKPQKPSCTTAGANFEITYIPAPGAGLSSDGNGNYVNGELGVIGRINCDGQSLELSGVRHSMLTLGAALSGTNAPWGHDPAPVAFFNIPLGIYFNNAQPSGDSTFTTYLKVTMASPNLGYFFNMENPDADAPLNSPDGGVNTPLTTTLVNVDHKAATASAPETWVVTPVPPTPGTPPAVGTLMTNAKGGLRAVGQFSAPFSITVTRQ